MSLRSKLILSISIGLIAIYLALFGWIQNFYKDQVIKEGIFEMVLTGKFLKSEIQNKTIQVEETVQNIAKTIEGLTLTDEEILSILRQTIVNNPGETYGMTMAYLPEIREYSPYFYMKRDSVFYKDLAQVPNYNYDKTNWFKDAVISKSSGWTNEAYTDIDGGEDKMITYCDHIYNSDGNLKAILTGDLSLDFVSEILTSKFATKFPYNIWILQNHEQILNRFDTGQNSIVFDKDLLNSATEVQDIEIENSMKLFKTKWNDQNIYILTIPLDFNNWDIQIAFKRADILNSYQKTIEVLQLLFLLGLIVLIIVTAWITHRAVKPILHLSESISKIGDGKLDFKVPYSNRKDEIGVLAIAFEKLQIDLKKYINDLKISISEQARVHNELEVGHDIQKALLPSPEDLKHIPSISIGSYMKPATEVGGDIYDYFELPDGNICFVLGDVSGKGIPASLLMASVRSSIRALATNGKSPSEILSYVNNDIAEKNETCHFITLICGVTDFENNQFSFCNAGHERPFLITNKKSPEEIITHPQVALGILQNVDYENNIITFEDNTTLFLYSDGVTDALNTEEISFGKTGLIQMLSQHSEAKIIVKELVSALERHTLKAEAFDDITMLAIQFKIQK